MVNGERASFANFVRLAKMRSVSVFYDEQGVVQGLMVGYGCCASLQEVQSGWQAAARLWIIDAKRVIFTHLDALVLATILSKAFAVIRAGVHTWFVLTLT